MTLLRFTAETLSRLVYKEKIQRKKVNGFCLKVQELKEKVDEFITLQNIVND